MFFGILGFFCFSSQVIKEKQEVECVVCDGFNFCYYDNCVQEKFKIVWFKFIDKCVFLIVIFIEQVFCDFVEKYQDYVDQIFVVCIKCWFIILFYFFGILVEKFGKMGDFKVEMDVFLCDNNFFLDEFFDVVLCSVNFQDWIIVKEDEVVFGFCRDFCGEKVFIFDFESIVEFGNGVYVKILFDGKVEIGVYVFDVIYFVKLVLFVDREVKKCGIVVQFMNCFCVFFLFRLFGEYCVLIFEEDCLIVSVVFYVNLYIGVVVEGDIWIGKGIVKSGGKLLLFQIDEVFFNQVGFSYFVVGVKDIQFFSFFVQKFYEVCFGVGGEFIVFFCLFQQFDDENILVKYNVFDSSLVIEFVEEFMYKINIYVVQCLVVVFFEKVFLCCYVFFNFCCLQIFVECMFVLGYEIDLISSGFFQNSLFRVDDFDIRKGMEILFLKLM